jgi:hypothetical protein
MRLKVALILAIVVAATTAYAHPATADSSGNDPWVSSDGPAQVVVGNATLRDAQDEGGRTARRPRTFAGPVVTYILDPQLRTDATGQPCVFIGSVEGDPASAAESDAEAHAFRLLSQYGLCPGSPKVPAKPTPGAAASMAFEQYVHLPAPTFQIPPGYSVTGTKTFVKIDGPQTLDPGPIDALGFAVTLRINSAYDIDWGDGSKTSGVTSQGGRGYPDGDLWHVYERTGTYAVTITQRWTRQKTEEAAARRPPQTASLSFCRVRGVYDA